MSRGYHSGCHQSRWTSAQSLKRRDLPPAVDEVIDRETIDGRRRRVDHVELSADIEDVVLDDKGACR